MPAFSSLLTSACALYTGARDTPEIATLLKDYGYAPADFEAGLDLTEDAEAAAGTQQAEYAQQCTATETAQQATADLEALFVRHRTLACLAHARGSDGYRGLGLASRLPGRAPELLAAASTFYRALADTPALAEGIRGLTAAGITDDRDRVEAARTAVECSRARLEKTSRPRPRRAARSPACAPTRARWPASRPSPSRTAHSSASRSA